MSDEWFVLSIFSFPRFSVGTPLQMCSHGGPWEQGGILHGNRLRFRSGSFSVRATGLASATLAARSRFCSLGNFIAGIRAVFLPFFDMEY
jgi:hypothetical protein